MREKDQGREVTKGFAGTGTLQKVHIYKYLREKETKTRRDIEGKDGDKELRKVRAIYFLLFVRPDMQRG